MTEDDDRQIEHELPAQRVMEAMLETWGERCPDFNEGCDACLAWAEYDSLMRAMDFRLTMERLKQLYSEALGGIVKH